MVASYSFDDNTFRVDKPRLWSAREFAARPRGAAYDLHPDGNRFALAAQLEPDTARQEKVVFIFNFFDELRRIAPVKK